MAINVPALEIRYPDDRQGILVQIPALPSGKTVDNIWYFQDGVKYFRRVKNGWLRASEFGIYPGLTDIGPKITALTANSVIKGIIFDEPEGAEYSVNTSVNAGYKTFKFLPGNKLIGTGTINNLMISAGYHQDLFAQTLTLNFPKSETGYFSVKWWGAKGDSTTGSNGTDDTAAFLKMYVANSQYQDVIIPRGYYRITASVAFNTANDKVVKFEHGAKIGGTGTVNGWNIDANKRRQIFDTTVTTVDVRSTDGRFSVMWYGAGAGGADDTTAIQKANDGIGERCWLYFPYGSYNSDGAIINVQTCGDGRRSRITGVTGSVSGKPIIRMGRHVQDGDVGMCLFRDLTIDGEGVFVGMDFYVNGTSTDAFAGRWHFQRIVYTNCTISVKKPQGNFGNTWDGCNFAGGANTQYHYYALDRDVNPNSMHAGLDLFCNKTRFQGATKAAVFIRDEEGGGTEFSDVIFEYCPGVAVAVQVGGIANHILPLVFHKVWLEQCGTGTFPLTIPNATTPGTDDLVISEAADFFFRDCNIVTMDRGTMGRIVCENSIVTTQNMSYAYPLGQQCTVDADSLIIEDSKFGYQYQPNDTLTINKMAFAQRTTNGRARFRHTFPSAIAKTGNTVLYSHLLDNVAGFTYTGSFDKEVVQDGELTGSVIQISNTTVTGTFVEAVYTPTANKYLVVGIGIKLVSGPRAMVYDGNSNFIVADTDNVGQWEYHYCILKSPNSTPTTLNIPAAENTGSVFRISCMMAVQFDTYMQAMAFMNRNIFPSTYSGGSAPIEINPTSDTSIDIPAGIVVTKLRVHPTGGDLTAFKAGLSFGDNGLITETAIDDEGYETFILERSFPTAGTIYFGGITGATNIKIFTETL